jgi:hypothetical protein
VEEPVPECVRFQPRHSRWRIVAFAGEHVVPLEDLVEDDSIHETAEADAEKESGRLDSTDRNGSHG